MPTILIADLDYNKSRQLSNHSDKFIKDLSEKEQSFLHGGLIGIGITFDPFHKPYLHQRL
jgi:hypothetical protein